MVVEPGEEPEGGGMAPCLSRKRAGAMPAPTSADLQACFQLAAHGAAVNGDTVVCPVPSTPGASTPASQCTRYVGVTYGGVDPTVSCASACSAFQRECDTLMFNTCKAHPHLAECACLAPAGTVITTADGGSLAFSQLQTFINEAGLGLPPQCAWAPCRVGSVDQLVPSVLLPTGPCPAMNITCAVTGNTINLQDVRAGNINIISQQCGAAGSSTNSSGSGSGSGGPLAVLGGPLWGVLAVVGMAVALLLLIIVASIEGRAASARHAAAAKRDWLARRLVAPAAAALQQQQQPPVAQAPPPQRPQPAGQPAPLAAAPLFQQPHTA